MTWREMLSMAISDGSTLEDVEDAIRDDRAILWVSERAAAVTQYVQVMDLTLAAGDMRELLEMLGQAEEQAMRDGIDRIVCTGRKGWSRALPGYTAMTVYVKELG